MFADAASNDFLRSRIDQMIDLRHPLVVLAMRMPWQEIEARVAQLLSRRGRAGVVMPNLDFFGEQMQRAAAPSNAGRPRVPLRIMIALLFLEHAFNESGEGVVERWGEMPKLQLFSGQAYFEHRLPCDATMRIRFRQPLGEEGIEELLAHTITVAVALKLIKPQEFARVIVNSTVQHEASAHPTDSRMLGAARAKLVEAAKDAGVDLKRTFAKEGKELSRKAGGYAHARQFKRIRRAIKRQRTIAGRLQREIDRKASDIVQAVRKALSETLNKARRIVSQSDQRKAADGQPKLYAWRASGVDCTSKGKARMPYEFGVKVGIDSKLRGALIVGARAFHGNLYDGDTLAEQLEQATILMQDGAAKPATAFADLDYRGVDADNTSVHIVYRGKTKRINEQGRKLFKRRQAIEPIIDHLKSDHRMEHCLLRGETVDRLHTVLCAGGYTIKWLLHMTARKVVTFLHWLYLRLFQIARLSPNYSRMLHTLAITAFSSPSPRFADA